MLTERLPDPSRAGTLQDLKSVNADEMAVDLEEPSAMELDSENGRTKKRFPLPTNPSYLLLFLFVMSCNDVEDNVTFTSSYSSIMQSIKRWEHRECLQHR